MYGAGVEQKKMDRELGVIKMCVFILNWESHLQLHQIEPLGHFLTVDPMSATALMLLGECCVSPRAAISQLLTSLTDYLDGFLGGEGNYLVK